MTKGDDLDKLKTVLIEENHNLKEEKEIHSKLIEDRVKQAKDDRETIKVSHCRWSYSPFSNFEDKFPSMTMLI